MQPTALSAYNTHISCFNNTQGCTPTTQTEISEIIYKDVKDEKKEIWNCSELVNLYVQNY